jgi:hypothetical protein
MKGLIGQPFMLLDDVDLLFLRKQLVTVEVGMTIETY